MSEAEYVSNLNVEDIMEEQRVEDLMYGYVHVDKRGRSVDVRRINSSYARHLYIWYSKKYHKYNIHHTEFMQALYRSCKYDYRT